MRRRLLGILVALGCAPSCSEAAYVGANCGDILDCRTDVNYGEGTECIEGRCRCPDQRHAEYPCCPGGGLGCAEADFECRPKAECEGTLPDAGADAPPDVEVPPEEVEENECEEATAADDCAKVLGLALDPACAEFACVKNRCDIKNLVLGPLPYDAPGDCHRAECGVMGNRVDVLWLEDGPIDTNPCTWGTCSATGEPEQLKLQDGVVCPDRDLGVCRDGACVDCDQGLNAYCEMPLSCDVEWCVPAHCVNGLLDVAMGESDANCGGPDCRPCILGQKCNGDADCLSGSCEGNPKVCVPSTHTDGKWNDSETGVDCGCDEGGCVPCPDGQGCALPSDCTSNVCFYGICRPASCFNGVLDVKEEALDCGGLYCPSCG